MRTNFGSSGRLIAVALFVFCACSWRIISAVASPRAMVITWGNDTPEWSQKLHVNAIRIGCSDQPASCVREIKSAPGDKVFLSILLKTAIPGAFGAQYGLLARQSHSLVSIGADDFVNQYEKLFRGGAHDPTPRAHGANRWNQGRWS